jgi:hypothetical protein
MQRRLEIEALEDRRLLTAILQSLSPVSVSHHQPAVVATVAPAPGSALHAATLAKFAVDTTTLPHGGVHVNHNQTLLRARRRKGRSR